MLEFRTGDGSEMVALAELACDVPGGDRRRPCVRRDQEAAAAPTKSRVPPIPRIAPARSLLQLAAAVAMTPDVPLPAAGA